MYGRDWIKVAAYIGTRDNIQVASHMAKVVDSYTKGSKKVKHWTDEENEKLEIAIQIHGKDYFKISSFVGTKTYD